MLNKTLSNSSNHFMYQLIPIRALVFGVNGSDPDFSLRQQTFNPIIAGWALCGNESSPQRVADWINQLTAISQTIPSLNPGLDTMFVKALAWRRYQERECLDDNELTLQIARKCSGCMVEAQKMSFEELVASEACSTLYVNVIKAWGNVSKQVSSQHFLYPINAAVNEMMNAVPIFDSKRHDVDVQDETQLQKKMLHCMGDIYTEAVCQLQELDALSISKDNSISFVGDRIADVERMLSNYELFVRSSMLNGTFDSEIEATRVRFFGKI